MRQVDGVALIFGPVRVEPPGEKRFFVPVGRARVEAGVVTDPRPSTPCLFAQEVSERMLRSSDRAPSMRLLISVAQEWDPQMKSEW